METKHPIAHIKDIGIEISLRNLEAKLACHIDVELIFGDRLKNLTVLIDPWIIRIVSDAGGLNGHADLMDPLPGHLDIGTTRANDAHLGVTIPCLVLIAEMIGDRQIQGSFPPNPLDPPEGGDDSPLILFHRVETGQHAADDKPSD